MSNKNIQSIPRIYILQEIYDEFDVLIQNYSSTNILHYSGHIKLHIDQVTKLIEILEVWDCGSIGGYDKQQNFENRRNIWHRFCWILNKYNKPNDLRFKYNSFKKLNRIFIEKDVLGFNK